MHLTPVELQTWLEWAGARLIAMPGGRIKPEGPRVIWPDYSQEIFEVLDFRGNVRAKAAIPSGMEISLAEKVMLLPNVCESHITRQILHKRAQVDPITGRYRNSWSKIAASLHCGKEAIKIRHKKGLLEVLSETPEPTFYQLSLTFCQIL